MTSNTNSNQRNSINSFWYFWASTIVGGLSLARLVQIAFEFGWKAPLEKLFFYWDKIIDNSIGPFFYALNYLGRYLGWNFDFAEAAKYLFVIISLSIGAMLRGFGFPALLNLFTSIGTGLIFAIGISRENSLILRDGFSEATIALIAYAIIFFINFAIYRLAEYGEGFVGDELEALLLNLFSGSFKNLVAITLAAFSLAALNAGL